MPAAYWILTLVLPFTQCTISPDFERFVENRYGAAVASRIARKDLGSRGSFGGGRHSAGTQTPNLPIVFVHGSTTTASRMLPSRNKFRGSGYSDAELYATTYGTGGNKTTLEETLACDYVKSIRALVTAVSTYTASPVSIVAYSLGVPLARKAVLGGRCVETKEDLGPPLNYVHTFIGIGGPNFGNELCALGVPEICNDVNGLNCESRFIRDINARTHYEGLNVYSILSKIDEVVGYEACGKVTARIAGSNATYAINVGHDPLLVASLSRQYQLVTGSAVATSR